jgi:hypothetical protein
LTCVWDFVVILRQRGWITAARRGGRHRTNEYPLSIEDEGSRVRDRLDLGAVSELHEAGQLGDKARQVMLWLLRGTFLPRRGRWRIRLNNATPFSSYATASLSMTIS